MLLVLALVACVQVELPMNVTRAHVDITGCLKSGISTRCTTCKSTSEAAAVIALEIRIDGVAVA